MSSHRKQETLPRANYADVAIACRTALIEMKLAVKEASDRKFTAREKANLLGFANPAKIVITLSDDADGIKIDVSTSNLGFGPIQGGHVKQVAETFLNTVRVSLSAASFISSPISLSDEIQKLAALRAQGLLTEEEFIVAKRKLI